MTEPSKLDWMNVVIKVEPGVEAFPEDTLFRLEQETFLLERGGLTPGREHDLDSMLSTSSPSGSESLRKRGKVSIKRKNEEDPSSNQRIVKKLRKVSDHGPKMLTRRIGQTKPKIEMKWTLQLTKSQIEKCGIETPFRRSKGSMLYPVPVKSLFRDFSINLYRITPKDIKNAKVSARCTDYIISLREKKWKQKLRTLTPPIDSSQGLMNVLRDPIMVTSYESLSSEPPRSRGRPRGTVKTVRKLESNKIKSTNSSSLVSLNPHGVTPNTVKTNQTKPKLMSSKYRIPKVSKPVPAKVSEPNPTKVSTDPIQPIPSKVRMPSPTKVTQPSWTVETNQTKPKLMSSKYRIPKVSKPVPAKVSNPNPVKPVVLVDIDDLIFEMLNGEIETHLDLTNDVDLIDSMYNVLMTQESEQTDVSVAEELRSEKAEVDNKNVPEDQDVLVITVSPDDLLPMPPVTQPLVCSKSIDF